ncbi:MAG: hypothetical protein LC768_08245 [Acidobacteria bacterium]|nr:hypothetical protein [Acidobacteriota bacterium]MCA1638310.1 hypothetical protein [Acidobacteriota bacterium]
MKKQNWKCSGQRLARLLCLTLLFTAFVTVTYPQRLTKSTDHTQSPPSQQSSEDEEEIGKRRASVFFAGITVGVADFFKKH